MNSFYKDLERGKAGEQKVYNYLSSLGFKVTDVSNDKSYWDIDVDFLVEDKNGKTHYIEVKSDWNISRTGNVLLETDKERGWFSKTKAEYIFYVDMKKDLVYVFKMEDMKKVLDQYLLFTIYDKDRIDGYKRIKFDGKNCVLINTDIHSNLFQVYKV